jgi:hypothetical protein
MKSRTPPGFPWQRMPIVAPSSMVRSKLWSGVGREKDKGAVSMGGGAGWCGAF